MSAGTGTKRLAAISGSPIAKVEKPSQPSKLLQLNLLENGLDFIREGVEALYGGEEPEPRAYKYALLHIFSGTLLVLKERLRRAHPSLIFQKVADYGKPNAKTVDFDEVINRLQGAVGVKLEQADATLLRKVQEKRNALEHFEADLELQEVNGCVGALIDFVDRFMHDELEEFLLGHVSGAAAEKLRELVGISKRIRERSAADLRKRMKRFQRLTKKQLAQLAVENESDPRDGGLGLLDCPACGENSVAIAEPDIGVCTAWQCRELFRLIGCQRCGARIFEGGYCCEYCDGYFQYQMDQD